MGEKGDESMAGVRKGENQKLKMLYLVKILNTKTDDEHGMTMQEIIAALEECGVNADRKTLYNDFEELRKYGVDIVAENVGRQCYYHIGEREFELPELKLLVDTVQSAKFVTDRKSRALIRKLEGLVSENQAKQLHRQVVISGRVKTMNEKIYYNVDKLHEAINQGVQIRFQYGQWTLRKQMELRRKGQVYVLSPWALMWDDENYYLVGYDADSDLIKHYRVDKMTRITLTGEKRKGETAFKNFDMARYSRSLFGMYGGEEREVTLEVANDMVGVIIDRFGKEIPIEPATKGHFMTRVRVAVSPQFFGWIASLGGDVRIAEPESVKEEMKSLLETLEKQY